MRTVRSNDRSVRERILFCHFSRLPFCPCYGLDGEKRSGFWMLVWSGLVNGDLIDADDIVLLRYHLRVLLLVL